MTAEAQVIGFPRGQDREENSLPNYTHSVKTEDTAKGLRFHVHVYGNGAEETALEALRTYESAVDFFKKNGHIIAPMNPNNNGGCKT